MTEKVALTEQERFDRDLSNERPNAVWRGIKKPSAIEHDDLYKVRLYLETGGDAQVYEDVKHLWWTADNSVLTILQYSKADRKEWRTIYWMREAIKWYQMVPQVFEHDDTPRTTHS